MDEDNISKEYYLFPELNISINNNLIKNEIYIPQYIIEEKKIKKEEGLNFGDEQLNNIEGIYIKKKN